MINFEFLANASYDDLGLIPYFLDPQNPDNAAVQFNRAYRHGGGWKPFHGFKLQSANMTLSYPGDPPMKPFAVTQLRDEKVYVYPHAWVLVLQPSGTFEVSRMD